MAEVILIRDVSEFDKKPLLHIVTMHVKEKWSERDLCLAAMENSFWVSELCWDYLAEDILQKNLHSNSSSNRSYIVVSNHKIKNGQYAENVVRHFVKIRKKNLDRFFIVSTNPFAIFKAWRQGFTHMKIRDEESRRMLYEAID